MKAWLIQSTVGRGDGSCIWWDGYGFTGDDARAIRFARRDDAANVIDRLLSLDGTLSPEEHEWSDQ